MVMSFINDSFINEPIPCYGLIFSDDRTVIAEVLTGLAKVLAVARASAAVRNAVRAAARVAKRTGEVVGAVHTAAPVTRAGRTRAK